MRQNKAIVCTLLTASVLLISTPSDATSNGASSDTFAGRNLIVYVPARLPSEGARSLVIVLHGGLGNAQRIESKQAENGLNLDAAAQKNGFIVAYLNGTPVTRLSANMLGWNAGGGCCGLSAANNVDDVGYIEKTANYLAEKYAVDRHHIYGMGHSNGAMMVQRMACETNLFAAIMAIAGPLNLHVQSCSAAHGQRILAIHGADDQNVPLGGGRGSKGISQVNYNSEELSKQTFIHSGASYELQVVPAADHYLQHLDSAIERAEGHTIAEKATRFFGIASGGQ